MNGDPAPARTGTWARRDRVRRWAAHIATALGVLGLVSAVSPPLRGRLAVLLEVLPLVVPRTAVLTLVFVSVALVLTARGLRRGHRVAWLAAELLLVSSVVLHLSKGLDVEEAVAAGAGAVWLGMRHRAFRVLPPRQVGIRGAVLAVVGAVSVVAASWALGAQAPWVGSGVPRASGVLVGRTAGNAPGTVPAHVALPALAAAAVALLLAMAWVLLTPRTPEPLTGEAHRRERERAREVVVRYGGESLDFFALRDDKQWFFAGQSVVAHAVRGSVCLVSPDPIGPADERAECWTEFLTYAERQGWSVAVIGAAESWLPIYESSGLRTFYLGDEAVVDCRGFTIHGHRLKSVRRAHRRVADAGYQVTFHEPADLDAGTRERLGVIAGEGRRGAAERGFSMTLSRLFDSADAGVLVAVVRDPAGTPVAFAQWVPAPHLPGWSLDVMRRSRAEGEPNGVMDFLIVETIWHVSDLGAEALGLNFAMWRRTISDDPATVAHLRRTVLRWMSRSAQIESLWRFNAKYDPRWVPRYAAVTADLVAAQSLAIAGAEGLVPARGRRAAVARAGKE
ncbi:bifunctional lysylphosphatidylglycerol flippase/synthetase MprF [Georgenia yuyongxinii]|uniref:DUF2156 domain-containing protein n=1 Tax=Georgenia yuyongxinii TaxID=2589797 RepID=A0A552WVH5_9MICO|nr:phosphatidylglycerol lysyltransferase domain-containing protein [Georgenia yuyongxinii]TRW46726.1 DUF2156 domain-containing protein [Georgenia yuyongxinii]